MPYESSSSSGRIFQQSSAFSSSSSRPVDSGARREMRPVDLFFVGTAFLSVERGAQPPDGYRDLLYPAYADSRRSSEAIGNRARRRCLIGETFVKSANDRDVARRQDVSHAKDAFTSDSFAARSRRLCWKEEKQ